MNTPGGNTNATAELTVSLMLSLQRNLYNATKSVKSGKWERKTFMGQEVSGKTLGIVGYGAIGKSIAEKARGLGMNIVVFDPLLTIEQPGVQWIKSIDNFWGECDFITFHTPLNKHTKNLLNKETIAKCKDGFKAINCARGGIINEKDILEALNSNKCGGLVLDVYSSEPPEGEVLELINHSKVVCTPHLGASTSEAQVVVAEMIANQISNGLLKDLDEHVVNEDNTLLKPNCTHFSSGPTKK